MVKSSDIKTNLGSNVRKLRKANGLSQEKLAECVNLERESVRSIENGRVFISAESLAAFSNYFNVEPDYFLKSMPIEHLGKDIEIKKEINRVMSSFTSDELVLMYKIANSIKK